MEIIYSPHAQKRLRERKISKVVVVLAVQNPDNQLLGERNRVIVQKHFGTRTLEVIYVVEANKIVIITLYYL